MSQTSASTSASGQKHLGILVSGGDCPGLNAAIRGAAQAAFARGWKVTGILNSTEGLMADPVRVLPLTEQMVDANFRIGGTMLGTTSRAACSPLNFVMPDGSIRDRSGDVEKAYHALGMTGLVVIGGDGSMGIMRQIAARTDVRFVGIPKTIDNDVGATEQTVGFDTAFSVATEAVDRLQPTAMSHQRVMILEVMGRDAGHIALNAGIAGGADIILIPEIPYTYEGLVEKLTKVRATGREHALIVVAEGVKGAGGEKLQVKHVDGQVRLGGIGQYLAAQLSERMPLEARVTVLGHVQRGAAPSPYDRLIATVSGAHAVDLVEKGEFDRMVIWRGRQVTSVPLAEALERYNTVTSEDTLVQAVRSLGIYIGN